MSFGKNLLTCTTNAFFTDVTDGFVASFASFTVIFCYFGKLNHYKFSMTSIFGIELHDCMCCGCTAREKVHYNCI